MVVLGDKGANGGFAYSKQKLGQQCPNNRWSEISEDTMLGEK